MKKLFHFIFFESFPEVFTSLTGKLEWSDELATPGVRVLTQSQAGVYAFTHTCITRASHHLETTCRDQTRETALAHWTPVTPAIIRQVIRDNLLNIILDQVILYFSAQIIMESVGGVRRTTEQLADSLYKVEMLFELVCQIISIL